MNSLMKNRYVTQSIPSLSCLDCIFVLSVSFQESKSISIFSLSVPKFQIFISVPISEEIYDVNQIKLSCKDYFLAIVRASMVRWGPPIMKGRGGSSATNTDVEHAVAEEFIAGWDSHKFK